MFVPFQAFEASAGSGKTFSLVVRYLSLLFMGEDANKILALTFTNKAANEMQERIIETLKDLPERGELPIIAEVTGLSKTELMSRRAEVLGRFLDADTKVMTIDKFFARILRKFSLHAGLMPDFSTFESQHELKVMARFLTLIKVEGKEKALIDLSLQASKRLSDIFTLLDELYGKSKELRHLTFTSEAYKVHEIDVMDAVKGLKRLIDATAVSKRGKASMEVDSIEALIDKTWLGKETLEYWDFRKYFIPEMDVLLKRIQNGVTDYMKGKERHFFHELFSLLDVYEAAKRMVAKEDSELSFDDITALVYYLLKERIDSEFLYFRLDSHISHLLLDEFQDTSIVQFEILRPLIAEIISGKGTKELNSFFLVGDVKQSIYRFRGGTKALFHTVTDAYGLQVDQLNINYRSHRNVVEFANSVFEVRIEGYERQLVKEGSAEGYIEVIEDEAILDVMLEKVKVLLALGADVNDIAILTATNADGSTVAGLLSSANIEVVTETTSRLINQKSIRALIEYLKYSYYGQEIYARNFFALVGMRPQRLKRCDVDSIDLPLEIKRVIEQYKLYDGDLDLFRFMEKLAGYQDIEQFLFEYERLDTAAAKADLSGVRVLTVHKSKGLEYEHVIVLDRLGRPSADRSLIIYDYDGISLENIYLRMKNRSALDKEYEQALEKEQALSEEDGLNALYVAFTRARSSLFVIQKIKGSKFSILGLEPQSRGKICVREQSSKAVDVRKELDYRALQFGTQCSVLTTEEREGESFDHHAIIFGLALHHTLEMMVRFSKDALPDALTSTQNRYGSRLDDEQFASLQRRITRLLDDAQFTSLCEGIKHKEKPISYKGELRYIDLLVEKDGVWNIIDYKSARTHDDAHHRQVGLYKDAIATITGEDVNGYLCYLLEDEVRIVEV